MSSADVVFVGGGPVGLWTAIQVKLRNRDKQVTVIEKYPHYKRTHYLNIDAHSLSGVPDQLKDLARKWGGRTVSIQTLENDLLARAKEVGVRIIRGREIPTRKLGKKFPNAKVFVGSDGARSSVRKDIFGDEFQFNSTQQYMVQVQYLIKGQDAAHHRSLKKIKVLSETYRVQKFAEHIISQNIRALASGDSQVTLQIFVDRETYEQMSDASFKTPYYFESDLKRVPKKLKEILKKWWGSQAVFHGKNIQRDKTNRITVAALNSYAAKEIVSVDRHGRVWALVGDSAAAFPYRRAINTGFLMGTELAIPLSKNTIDPSNFNAYTRYARFRITLERIKAYFKNLMLNATKWFLSVSNWVFWQVNKLSPQQRKQITEAGERIWRKIVTPSVKRARARKRSQL